MQLTRSDTVVAAAALAASQVEVWVFARLGGTAVSAAMAGAAVARQRCPSSPGAREVLELMVEGLSNAEMAARLCISVPTAKSHVAAILRKLGVRDRTRAVVAALTAPSSRRGES